MKVKINSILKNVKGQPLNGKKECCVIDKDGNFIKTQTGDYFIKTIEVPEEKLTLKDICLNVLMSLDKDEKTDGEEKYKRFKLGMLIGDSKEYVELDAEEITKIKKLIGNLYSPLILGQCYDILENKQ